jgi:hypothetical protein
MILLWNFTVKLGLFCGCLHNHLFNKVPPPSGLLVCQGVLSSLAKLTSVPTEAAVCLPVTAEGRVRSESIACWTLDARRSREQIHLRVNPFCPVRRILPMFRTHNLFIHNDRLVKKLTNWKPFGKRPAGRPKNRSLNPQRYRSAQGEELEGVD